LWLPSNAQPGRQADERLCLWLQTVFPVADLVEKYPGVKEATQRYGPSHGPFCGENYPKMYSRSRTAFDDTILLVENKALREKILLEYKTGKSSRGQSVDGNVHERLSFQIMQYLEAATRYSKCSLVVLANGAFIRYRNKYHVSFHIQADRLRNFGWFAMRYICEQDEHVGFADELLNWLIKGKALQHGR